MKCTFTVVTFTTKNLFSVTGLNPIIQIIEPILDNMVNEAVSEVEMATENIDTSYSSEVDISGSMTSDSISKEVTHCTHKQWSAHYYGKALTQFT